MYDIIYVGPDLSLNGGNPCWSPGTIWYTLDSRSAAESKVDQLSAYWCSGFPDFAVVRR